MAYINFDQIDYYGSGAGHVPMFTADGQITTHYSLISDLPQRPCSSQPGPAYAPGHTFQQFQDLAGFGGQYDVGQFQQIQQPPMMGYGHLGAPGTQQTAPPLPNIRNMKELYRVFGRPDATDRDHGGIAIWSAATLKKAGYGFLRRVEIIDENVPSVTPVKHFSNVYIWVHIKPTQDQLNNILSLSKDFFYDRKKELLIVRSACLDTAVAQASLILLYTKGQLSFYDLVNNDMLKVYYTSILKTNPKCKKVKKALYTILNTTKKMKK